MTQSFAHTVNNVISNCYSRSYIAVHRTVEGAHLFWNHGHMARCLRVEEAMQHFPHAVPLAHLQACSNSAAASLLLPPCWLVRKGPLRPIRSAIRCHHTFRCTHIHPLVEKVRHNRCKATQITTDKTRTARMQRTEVTGRRRGDKCNEP